MCRSQHWAIDEENDMTTQDDRAVGPGSATSQHSDAAPAQPTTVITEAPPSATGVPLAAFAFAFAVGVLGLVDTGILASAASFIFIAVAFGIGAIGLFVGGVWEIRQGELFGGTFAVGYSGFLVSTGLILKFYAADIIATAGVNNFNHAFAAWLILWGIFTAIFAIGARVISLAAFMPFLLAVLVFALLSIATLGGAASWASDFTRIGGWVALVDSLAAGYLASAILLNVTMNKQVLPLWPHQPSS
jgi:uncharacterized protein